MGLVLRPGLHHAFQPKDVLALSLNGEKRFSSRKVLLQPSRHAYALAQPEFGDAATQFAATCEEGLKALAEGSS